MVERAIRLRSSAVRAILDGTQTVLRQPMKPQPDFAQVYDWRGRTLYDGEHRRWFYRGHYLGDVCCNQPDFSEAQLPLGPYGAPGDRLWVQETWCSADWWTTGRSPDPPEHIRYAADNSALDHTVVPPRRLNTRDWTDPKRWRPSIHMPRWASRLSLDVVSVRVERLHSITDAEAELEGIGGWSKDGVLFKYAPADDEGDGPMWPWQDCPRTPRDAFERLWREINGAGMWLANPWVWRVEFRRAEVPRA